MTRIATDGRTRELLERIRPLLPDGHVREVRMFGVLAMMLDDAMAVAVHKDGSLLVRVDRDEDASLLARPHASRPAMGGRSMGQGWIRVDGSGVGTDAELGEWVDAVARCLGRRRPSRT